MVVIWEAGPCHCLCHLCSGRFRGGGVVPAAVDNLSLEHATLVIGAGAGVGVGAGLGAVAGAAVRAAPRSLPRPRPSARSQSRSRWS